MSTGFTEQLLNSSPICNGPVTKLLPKFKTNYVQIWDWVGFVQDAHFNVYNSLGWSNQNKIINLGIGVFSCIKCDSITISSLGF